jgi:hypothetical protein
MVRKDQVVKCGRMTVIREEYVHDQELMARAFGVEGGKPGEAKV